MKARFLDICFLFRVVAELENIAEVALGNDDKKVFPKQLSKKVGKKAKSKAALEEEIKKLAVSPAKSVTSKTTMELNESCTYEKQEGEELAIKNLQQVDVMKETNDNQGLEESNAVNDWKNQLCNYISPATGLKVLSVTSSTPGYAFTAGDRAKIVRNIPGVVIINTTGKGDVLFLEWILRMKS